MSKGLETRLCWAAPTDRRIPLDGDCSLHRLAMLRHTWPCTSARWYVSGPALSRGELYMGNTSPRRQEDGTWLQAWPVGDAAPVSGVTDLLTLTLLALHLKQPMRDFLWYSRGPGPRREG